jgi:hypothetical protein
VAQLWALPPLQANRREQQPPFRPLPLHRSYLGATKGLAWHYWFDPRQWAGIDIHDWWSSLVEGTSPQRKGLSSLALLVVWEIWMERNARVFRNKLLSSVVIFDLIKAEARL